VTTEEDKQAVEILKSTTKCVNGRYEIGFMWKNSNVVLPNNRTVALRHLFMMERRFKKDLTFAEKYEQVVNEYVSLGHKPQELSKTGPRTWYLPHHGVVNPNRPGKVRVVFNASAVFQGTSLNASLHKGPDLLTSLLGVLLRFRRKPIPLSADIEKMYHQVRVKEEDREFLLFVWRTEGSQAPQTYQMQVHIFGAVSSPTTCLYALRRCAEDNREEFVNVADLVKENFYVDNYLDSLETEEEAIRRAKEITDLLKLGSFRLNKWISSSRKVLASIDAEELISPQLDLDLDELR